MYRYEESEACYVRGLSVATNDSQRGTLYLNYSSLHASMGQWAKAEDLARKATALTPNSLKAKANLGLALLGQGKWVEGWVNYNQGLGIKHHLERRRIDYGAKDWKGEKGRVVLYSEQGLGDEISFASMIPDALTSGAEIIVDCDHRLKGLFKRSFGCEVHGTRWASERPWVNGIEYQASFAELGERYRQSDGDFPRKPYLVADPERVTMWKSLFKTFGKPVIGIAWSGGLPATGERYRKVSLEDLLPVFRAKDAVWVCLQYKDASEEIAAFKAAHPEIDIRQYPFATLTKDYDDTAALVDALDEVVSMQTAVIHLAGALGKKTTVLVHKYSQWRYGTGDSMLWYPTVRIFRQGMDNSWPIEEVACSLA
jgi:tetratricopeptide (TPR) repeat protein